MQAQYHSRLLDLVEDGVVGTDAEFRITPALFWDVQRFHGRRWYARHTAHRPPALRR